MLASIGGGQSVAPAICFGGVADPRRAETGAHDSARIQSSSEQYVLVIPKKVSDTLGNHFSTTNLFGAFLPYIMIIIILSGQPSGVEIQNSTLQPMQQQGGIS
jgi:hypothetical protein